MTNSKDTANRANIVDVSEASGYLTTRSRVRCWAKGRIPVQTTANHAGNVEMGFPRVGFRA